MTNNPEQALLFLLMFFLALAGLLVLMVHLECSLTKTAPRPRGLGGRSGRDEAAAPLTVRAGGRVNPGCWVARRPVGYSGHLIPIWEPNMSTDAIVLLKQDHKEILSTFKKFEKAGDNAHKAKADLVNKMIKLLTVHTYIENEVMYTRVRDLLPEVEDDVLESYEEHHAADVLVMELVGMKPTDERFTAKTTVLIENVTHHIEEEQEWFPKVREGLGRSVLQEIGAEMVEAKKNAPRSPAQPSALKKTVDAVIK
ncbi:hemerythrin domain-containing protein [Aeromicrobium sp.]|uniref:hemerythrin domain-containing protein n=1 Tax=Aeromicrobium sp. TaxID=1871063 RepID=UPI0025C14DA0|nr:hemerythrin domain-containing protein [Aeromicrobium sp.]